MAQVKVGDLLDLFFNSQMRKFSTKISGSWASSTGGMTTYNGTVFINFTGKASAAFKLDIGYTGDVAVILNDTWQTLTFPYAMQKDDVISIAFNYVRGA